MASCGIRTRVADMFRAAAARPKTGLLDPLDEHDLVVEISTSAVSIRESSRRMRCLAARVPGPARAHPDTAYTLRFAATECMGTPEVERQGETFRPAPERALQLVLKERWLRLQAGHARGGPRHGKPP